MVTVIMKLLSSFALGTEERTKNNESMAHSNGAAQPENHAGIGEKLRDAPDALYQLMRNPVLVCQCLAFTMHAFIITGIATFIVKFTANQFNLGADQAAITVGKIW